MRATQSLLAVGVIVASMALPNISWAKSELDLRLTRLENIVQNEVNIGLLNQLEVMQQEIRELSGKLEEQQNAMQALSQKQEKLFLNLDRRVNSLSENTHHTVLTPALIPEVSVAAETALNVETDEADVDEASTPAVITEKSVYDAAYNLMNAKKYSQAVTEFKDLIWQFPEGKYAASSYYWLGEIYLVQWQEDRVQQSLLEQAKESFTTVTNKYRGDPKEIDALLKLGMIEIDLGNLDVAKAMLKQVVAKQPNSSRARIAEGKLKSIEQPKNL